MNNRLLSWPFAVGLALSVGAVEALEIRASGDVSVEHTDNARKSSSDELSETQPQLGVNVSGEHSGERVTTNFSYRADHRFYSRDSQSERTVLEGLAALRWEQINEALFWDLSHSRRDLLRDNALTDVRENRDERDLTEISPLFIMQLSAANSLQARARYSMVTYRSADHLDSDRYGANLTWARRMSRTDSLFFAIDSEEVTFDSNFQDEYRKDSASVAYSTQLARLSYTATVGYNRAVRDVGSDVSGPLLALDINYDDGSRQWYGRFDSRITDSSLGYGNRDIFDSIDTADTTIGTVDIVKKSRLEVGMTTPALCALCETRAAVYFDREEYDTEPRDNDEYGLQGSISYRLSTVSSVTGVYHYRSTSYRGDNMRSEYDQNELRFDYSRQLTRLLVGTAFVGYIDRSGSGSGSGFGTGNYDEARFGVRLTYQFL